MAAVLALALAGACGDDDMDGEEGNGDEDDVEGEICLNPGQTMTGCMCSSDRPPGSRMCTSDGVWSACRCPPHREPNECDFEGQAIQCWPCSGETEGRMTECLEDGTFDCSCQDGGVPLEDAGRP